MNKNIIPKISVVMAVYNGEKYLREAIDSILNQTFNDFEFIIINDGSTDDSAEIIKSYNDPRIILIQQENKGLAAALNEGIKIAKGKFIARMDADDISLKTRLEKQIQFMEAHPEYVAIGSWSNHISADGDYLYTCKMPLESSALKDELPDKCPFIHTSVLMRTDEVQSVVGYKNVGRYFYQEEYNGFVDSGQNESQF